MDRVCVVIDVYSPEIKMTHPDHGGVVLGLVERGIRSTTLLDAVALLGSPHVIVQCNFQNHSYPVYSFCKGNQSHAHFDESATSCREAYSVSYSKGSFMRIYFAAPLFTQAERRWNRALAESIINTFTSAIIILPQDFDVNGKHDAATAYGPLFATCLQEIERADVILAVIDGTDPDCGTSWEMGYAYARGKPIVGLRTDFRPGFDDGVNIMLSGSCAYFVKEYSYHEDLSVMARAVVRRLKQLKLRSKI